MRHMSATSRWFSRRDRVSDDEFEKRPCPICGVLAS